MRRIMAEPTPWNSFSVVNWYPRRDISICVQQRCEQIICTHKLLQCFRQLMENQNVLTAANNPQLLNNSTTANQTIRLKTLFLSNLTLKSKILNLRHNEENHSEWFDVKVFLRREDRSYPDLLVNKVWKSILAPAVAPEGPGQKCYKCYKCYGHCQNIVRPRWRRPRGPDVTLRHWHTRLTSLHRVTRISCEDFIQYLRIQRELQCWPQVFIWHRIDLHSIDHF